MIVPDGKLSLDSVEDSVILLTVVKNLADVTKS